jgi:hypothetical protein
VTNAMTPSKETLLRTSTAENVIWFTHSTLGWENPKC